MSKWFVHWKLDMSLLPKGEEAIKLQMMMLDMVKADMKAGTIQDFGIRSGESSGYGISGDMSAEEINAWLMKWTPYVKFEANPVINVDQQKAALQKTLEMLKKK
jgi:hypothetical protein